MTVLVDPGTDANSYIDAAVRPWKTTAGLWKAKDVTDAASLAAEVVLYNAQVALVATRDATIVADAAALAAEVALYNAQVALVATRDATIVADAAALAAALSPAAADIISGGALATTFNNAGATVMTLTVDRTGYWLANYAGVANATSVTNGDHVDINILYNGVAQVSNSITYHAQTFGIFALGTTPILITSGQTITVTLTKTSTDVVTMNSQNLYAIFVPRQSNPH